jgi:hypothetical protein
MADKKDKPERNRVRHDDKDKQFQVKGKTTRKLIENQRKGVVDFRDEHR